MYVEEEMTGFLRRRYMAEKLSSYIWVFIKIMLIISESIKSIDLLLILFNHTQH
jgi:hypothetical protein